MIQPIKDNISAYTTESETWQGMLSDINHASHSIIYEQFIVGSFGPGEIGLKLVEALCQAAGRGVAVKLRLDAVGSIKMLFNRQIIKQLQECGVETDFYQVMPLRNMTSPLRLFLRNHRKVLLIDERISWLGGAVMGERFRTWHDYSWRIDSAQIGEELGNELGNQYHRLVTGKRTIAPFSRLSEDLRLVGNSPGIGNRHVYEQICEHVLLSRNRIILVSPYFVPPYRLRQVLKERLQEGFEVILLTVKESDHKLADWARWVFVWRLFNLGMKVYMAEQMNHAKIVIGDKWFTFGSTNLDYLSLIFNHELNIDSEDQVARNRVLEMISTWQNDLYVEFDAARLRQIKPVWWQRLIGYLLRIVT